MTGERFYEENHHFLSYSSSPLSEDVRIARESAEARRHEYLRGVRAARKLEAEVEKNMWAVRAVLELDRMTGEGFYEEHYHFLTYSDSPLSEDVRIARESAHTRRQDYLRGVHAARKLELDRRDAEEFKEGKKEVLRAWGLGEFIGDPRLETPDGKVLLAHLCNAVAKFDPFFYGYKPGLIAAAAEVHPFCWKREGIIYFETCVGQVSFHVFGDEGSLLSERETPWAGGWMQEGAYIMALAFLGQLTKKEEMEFDRWLAEQQPATDQTGSL